MDVWGVLVGVVLSVLVYVYLNRRQLREFTNINHGGIRHNIAPNPLAFRNKQGLWIHTTRYLPLHTEEKDWKAVVFFAHGYGGYGSRRWRLFTDHLNKRGIAVFAIDHQGFGHSEGTRGYIQDFDHLVEDFLTFIKTTLESPFIHPRNDSKNQLLSPTKKSAFDSDSSQSEPILKNVPKFLMGESLGGTISLRVLQKLILSSSNLSFDGLILLAPAIRPNPILTTWPLLPLAHHLSNILPKLPVLTLNPYNGTLEREAAEAYMADPLVYTAPKRLMVRTGNEMMKGMERVRNGLGLIKTAMLVVQGTKDNVTDGNAIGSLMEEYGGEDKTWKSIVDGAHDLFSGPKKDQVLKDVGDWIEERSFHNKFQTSFVL
eukprot:TRINITY_DN5941_c0_g1_i1.p1 TRINITY_DN5941_c0_g1~~TRINITY_DN5941_c0_g1_i1.p1  ORF type:complete len:373 (-),score=80.83 TRINITY_DN5941_c0_g1_i1:19-1137(-)